MPSSEYGGASTPDHTVQVPPHAQTAIEKMRLLAMTGQTQDASVPRDDGRTWQGLALLAEAQQKVPQHQPTDDITSQDPTGRS